jgi:hypothetical protein
MIEKNKIKRLIFIKGANASAASQVGILCAALHFAQI